MAADSETLEVAVEELHRIYDHISNTYDQLRVKALALLGGELAVVSFIFSGSFNYPKLVFGQISFWIGLVFLAVAFVIFLLTISALKWAVPVEFGEIEAIEKYADKKAFLKYVKKDYLEAVKECIEAVERRVKRFDWGLYLLLLGAIILLVIKFKGNRI